MIRVTCIQKVRDPQGKIVSYLMEDECHNQKMVEPLDLKATIINGAVQVTNLKLTSDGRLIDSNPNEGNTEDDILAIQDEYNANKFIEDVADLLDTFGIKATIEELDTHTQLGLRNCAVIEFNNGKIIGTSGNGLDINPKIAEILRDKEHKCYGITAGLLVKTTQKDGNNKLLDYKIFFGAVKRGDKDNVLDDDALVLGNEFSKKMSSVLNYRMDAYEASSYRINYDKKQIGKNVNYRDSQQETRVAAVQLVDELIKILGIPDKQLSKTVQLANTLSRGIVGKAVEKKKINTALNSGYNTDVVKAHKEQMAANEEMADIAAEYLGTDNSRFKEQNSKFKKQQETAKNLKNSKGLFGMMKAFDRK